MNKIHHEIDKKDIHKYTIKLCEREIGVLKAALQYFVMDNDFGYCIWEIETATYGSSDTLYADIANYIYKKLDKLSNTKPNFGYWCDIDRIEKFCRKYLNDCEKEAKEFNKKYLKYGIEFSNRFAFSEEKYKEIDKQISKEKKKS